MSSNAIESSDSAIYTDSVNLDNSSNSSSQTDLENVDLEDIESLIVQLQSDNLKKSIQAVRSLAKMETEAADKALVDTLEQRGQIAPSQNRIGGSNGQTVGSSTCGSSYQYLFVSTTAAAKSFVERVPNGIVRMESERDVSYDGLQKLLVQRDYQAADKLTTELMSEIAGDAAVKRKWVYFTEVSQFPNADILTIDTLWRTYSEDKFGWSQQRNLWLRLGRNWERLWPQISWQSSEGAWTRYPTEFVWDLDAAPIGHLPLFNQLRGVRVMNALLEHPVWSSDE